MPTSTALSGSEVVMIVCEDVGTPGNPVEVFPPGHWMEEALSGGLAGRGADRRGL
jgi:hypothetical protein